MYLIEFLSHFFILGDYERSAYRGLCTIAHSPYNDCLKVCDNS